MIVRKLKHDEELPDTLRVPFPKLDEDWVWVGEESQPVAALYGCDMQGLAQLIVLRTTDEAPEGVLVTLFCEVCRDLRSRGYQHIITFLSATEKAELKLVRIVQRLGGRLEPRSGYFATAPIPERHRTADVEPSKLSPALAWVLGEEVRV